MAKKHRRHKETNKHLFREIQEYRLGTVSHKCHWGRIPHINGQVILLQTYESVYNCFDDLNKSDNYIKYADPDYRDPMHTTFTGIVYAL